MRFATFVAGGDHHLGVVDGEEIADVTAVDGGLGPDLGAVLAAGRLAEVATAVRTSAPHPAAGRHPGRAGAAPSEGARHRPELRHARRRDRRGAAAAPALVQQAVDLRHRPGCPDRGARRVVGGRLRRRAGLRHRASLPARAGRAGGRGDRRLHDLQRRERARLADAHPDDDDGQVLRHPRPDRSVGRHRRRARRPPRAVAAHVGERRAAPGREDRRPHLRLLRHGRAPLDGLHPRARRRDLHRHARRRRHRHEPAPAAAGRRRRAHRDRGHRHAREPGRSTSPPRVPEGVD